MVSIWTRVRTSSAGLPGEVQAQAGTIGIFHILRPLIVLMVETRELDPYED